MSEDNGRSHINKKHWWAIVVDDAAQLADALNEADNQGFDIHSIHATATGFVIVVNSYITHVNEYLLKGPSNAKKEKETTAVPPTGIPVHNPTQETPPLGIVTNRKCGNNRAKKQRTTIAP